ncbi:MAG: hypothetical protein JSS02_10475 [Planctomycetes bacterium]|nr:hypothetical protein [Planctomycetota bacterium]
MSHHTIPSETEPTGARESEAHAIRQLKSFMQALSVRAVGQAEFESLRQSFNTLPKLRELSEDACQRLRKAERFLRSAEIGSALYELRLLASQLQAHSPEFGKTLDYAI